MKLKYYLRGAGIAMIVTAVIMSIAFSNIDNSPKVEESGETPDHGETVQMATEAEEADSIDGDTKSEKADKVAQNEAATVNDSDETGKAEDSGYINQETKTPDDIADNTEENKQTETEEESNPSDEEVTSYKVTIISGEVSNRIADRLEGLGLVDDGAAFNKYMEENKIDHALRPGTYIIEKGLTYEEIADILMKK